MAARRRRTVKARRRGTRAGMRRRTARRAFAPKRRTVRRRSNPKGIMGTPAFRYATATAAGAAAEVVVNQTGFLAKTFPNRLARGAVYALLTVMIGRQVFKGKARENAVALGVGMIIPSLIAQVGTFQLGSGLTDALVTGSNGNGNGNRRVASIRRAALSSPYAAARAHAVQDSGLKAI